MRILEKFLTEGSYLNCWKCQTIEVTVIFYRASNEKHGHIVAHAEFPLREENVVQYDFGIGTVKQRTVLGALRSAR